MHLHCSANTMKTYGIKVAIMKKFTFEAMGKTFTADAENGIDIMEDANRALLWSNWQDGIWNQVSETKFIWVLGNFYD
jgi:hypothetical protein